MGVEVRALHCDADKLRSHRNPTSRFVGGFPTKPNTGLQSRELHATPFWSFYRSPVGEGVEYQIRNSRASG